jgi:hypothetical protein
MARQSSQPVWKEETDMRKDEQSGFVIVMVAILIFVLIGFMALALDLGILYSARAQTQAAADAAALAGAFTFIVNPSSPQPATAQLHARQAATNNRVLGNSIAAGEVSVSVDLVTRRVTVDIARTQTTLFAKVLNIANVGIGVHAVAEAAQNSTHATCAKPWFIPNTLAAPVPACTACASGQVLISGGQPTAFARSNFGLQFTVKPQSPSGAIAPSQFYAIEMGGPGASDYRRAIAECSPDGSLYCRSSYSVKTGNMVGPTKQGVNDLIGNPPRDKYVGLGQYQPPDGTIRDTSAALVVAPIVDLCSTPGFCPSNKLPSGTNVTLPVLGFALIFIEGVQNGGPNDGVKVRLINVFSCDAITPPPDATVFSIPIRLVRTT